MKKLILPFTFLFITAACLAQTINLEPIMPVPQLQDSDVGAVDLGDIDNDGDLDLITIGRGSGIHTALYSNDGDGNFNEIMTTPFANLYNGTVDFADIDNDGDQDVLMTGWDSSPNEHTDLYRNDGNGTFSLITGTPLELIAGGDVEFGDVDNDGDLDLLMTGKNMADVGIAILYLNDGLGAFTEAAGTPFTAVSNSSLSFFDMDNDNDNDIFIVGMDNNDALSMKLYENDGMGNFTVVANTSFLEASSGAIAIGDSDNDGDQDILISGTNGPNRDKTHLYINDGTGSFTLLNNTSFTGTTIGGSDFADFDNDGDLDILISGSSLMTDATFSIVIAYIYENQGSNNFILADVLPGAYLADNVVGDIDGDNDLDVVITGTSFQSPARAGRIYRNITSCHAQTINCGQTYSGDTNLGTNNFDTYDCENWDESGKELVYRITTETQGDIVATLSNDTQGDLDVFIISDCMDSQSCIAAGDEVATAINQPAGAYYIVVDGFEGATSTFNLIVTADCVPYECNRPAPFIGNIPTNTYQQFATLLSRGTVATGANVIFKATNSITLEPGFEVALGAEFEAVIGECANNFAARPNDRSRETQETAEANLPAAQALQVFPNPFSGQTTIAYHLDKPTTVSLHIYDLNGQLVEQLMNPTQQIAGDYQIVYQATKRVEGIYIAILQTDDAVLSQRLVLMK